jgi:hypothetical protein
LNAVFAPIFDDGNITRGTPGDTSGFGCCRGIEDEMRIVEHGKRTSEESFAFITANIAAKITKQPIIRPTILILLPKNR